MSVSVIQLVNEAGWDELNYHDALWIKSQEQNWGVLLERAELTIRHQEDYESEQAE